MITDFQIEQIPAQLTLKLRKEVMYPDMTLKEVQLPQDDDGYHFGLYYQNQLVTVVSTFIHHDKMQFRKFATQNNLQKLGFGSAMLKHIIGFAKKQNIRLIWCNARQNASGFYAKFGFVKTESTFHKDGFDFVIMEKSI